MIGCSRTLGGGRLAWLRPEPGCFQRASPGYVHQAETFLNPGSVQLARCDCEGEVKCLVAGQVQAVAVDPKENHSGEQREPFIAIDQRMIARERMHQRASLPGECGIGLLPEETGPGPVRGRGQQAKISVRARSKRAYQAEKIFQAEELPV